jgi:deoxyribonuclease V
VDVVRERFRPDPDQSTEAMAAIQREIAETAVFADRLGVDPETICAEAGGAVVAGVDQAFRDDGDVAVSAVVARRGADPVERATATVDCEIPYVPGLLAFREGEAVLAALERLACEPALLLVDGSGRIHYRQAGLATHVGVALDVPAIGVAKSLLCGTPAADLDQKRPAGARVAITADEDVEAPAGTLLGYAVQTRQWDRAGRHINPLYVSPGHRVSAATAADCVLSCTADYKLPEPVRAADRYAGDLAAE